MSRTIRTAEPLADEFEIDVKGAGLNRMIETTYKSTQANPLQPTTAGRRRLQALRCRGFTFIEVLFAVIILGVGMIMIAAMLPVAVKQGQETREEMLAKATMESAYALIRASATNAAYGPTTAGAMVKVPPAAVAPIAGDMVLGSDPRYGWVAFYARDASSTEARFIVMAIKHTYPEGDQNQLLPNFYALAGGVNEPAMPVTAQIYDGLSTAPGRPSPAGYIGGDPLTPDIIDFGNININGNPGQRLVEGAYVIVSSDADTAGNSGRIFRLGKLIPNTLSKLLYELDPAFDLPPLVGLDGQAFTADDQPDRSLEQATDTVTFMGRGAKNQTVGWNAGSNPYNGPAQDMAVLKFTIDLAN